MKKHILAILLLGMSAQAYSIDIPMTHSGQKTITNQLPAQASWGTGNSLSFKLQPEFGDEISGNLNPGQSSTVEYKGPRENPQVKSFSVFIMYNGGSRGHGLIGDVAQINRNKNINVVPGDQNELHKLQYSN